MPTFTNRQFGTFEFSEEHRLTFPAGIIGFEELKNFIIVNDEDSEPFRWLVSLDDGDLSFPVIDPVFVTSAYQRHLPDAGDKSIFLIASLRERPEDSTVNLRSPVVIDAVAQTGRQVILSEDTLPVNYRFLAGLVPENA